MDPLVFIELMPGHWIRADQIVLVRENTTDTCHITLVGSSEAYLVFMSAKNVMARIGHLVSRESFSDE